jgi:uncharacterized protein (DUF302 family)
MTNPLWFILGIVLGLMVMGAAVWFAMPKLMLIKRRTDRSYTQTVQVLTESLQKLPDWRLKLMNNYQESTASFGKIEPICSMNVCNSRLAYDILSEDANRGVTAIMPVAIGVYEDKKGMVYTSQLNVGLLGMMFGGTIARVMKLAARDLDSIISSVTAK